MNAIAKFFRWKLIEAYRQGTQEDVPEDQRIPNYKLYLQNRARREGRHRDHYLRGLVFTRRTYLGYVQIAERFAEYLWGLGLRSVREIKRRHVRSYIECGLRERSWRKLYARQVASALTKLGECMGRRELFDRPAHVPLKGHDYPAARPIRVISDEELARVLPLMEDEGKVLAALLRVCAGLRLAEATSNLRWLDGEGRFAVRQAGDADRCLFVVPCGKGGKERFAAWIPKWLGERLWIYYRTNDGAKLDDYDGHRLAWRDACKRVGAPTNTHSTRHRHARKLHLELCRQGMSPEEAAREVAQRLGHGPDRPDVTALYLGYEGAQTNSGLNALALRWSAFSKHIDQAGG